MFSLQLVFAVLVTASFAVVDVFQRRFSNFTITAFLLASLAVLLLLRESLLTALFVGSVTLVLCLPAWQMRLIGGGDAKLIAVLGLLIGERIFWIVLIAWVALAAWHTCCQLVRLPIPGLNRIARSPEPGNTPMVPFLLVGLLANCFWTTG